MNEEKLNSLKFLSSSKKSVPPKNSIAKETFLQLQRYFDNPQFKFDLPIELIGTPFQIRVWRFLQKIPPGKTLTYGELAKKLKTSARAIGNACRANPLPIIIPCHRIVSATGLGGFAGKQKGEMITIKKALLAHENQAVLDCKDQTHIARR